MHKVEPKVFLVGETRIIEEGLQAFLDHIGVPDWTSNAPSDAEKLIEVMGKLCYRSFEPGLNKNIKKVRTDNKDYIGHILEVGHGSVIEHSMMNFIISDVSRVFTHELVRHRVGVAISQESLRFVRLDDLGGWAPTVIRENEKAMEVFVKTFEELEKLQLEWAKLFNLDDPKVSFEKKKIITSAMRRIAPLGLSTTIGWSANPRTLRFLLALRTDPAAEEEIRLVFGKIAEIVIKRYPNIFGDFKVEVKNGLPHYTTAHHKV